MKKKIKRNFGPSTVDDSTNVYEKTLSLPYFDHRSLGRELGGRGDDLTDLSRHHGPRWEWTSIPTQGVRPGTWFAHPSRDGPSGTVGGGRPLEDLLGV